MHRYLKAQQLAAYLRAFYPPTSSFLLFAAVHYHMGEVPLFGKSVL